jgi:hypothetical protein
MISVDSNYTDLPQFGDHMTQESKFASLVILAFLAFPMLIGAIIFLAKAPQFLPTTLALGISIACGIALAAIGIAFVWRTPLRSRGSQLPLTGVGLVVGRLWIVFVFGVSGIGFGSVATVDLAAYYTAAAGSPSARQVVVTGWREKWRSSCAGPEFAGTSSMAKKPCMEHPVSIGTVLLLRGRVTSFGLQVATVAIISQP